MEIEIRDMFVRQERSKASINYMAYVYVDGRLAATAHNNGEGLPTTLTPAGEGGLKAVTDAEKYCEETRGTWVRAGMLSGHHPANGTPLSEYADMRVTQQFIRERDELMKTKLLYGHPGDKGYAEIPFEIDIARFLTAAIDTKMLREFMRHTVIPMLSGRKIINTNLSHELVETLGISDHVLYKPERKKKTSRRVTGRTDTGKDSRQSPGTLRRRTG